MLYQSSPKPYLLHEESAFAYIFYTGTYVSLAVSSQEQQWTNSKNKYQSPLTDLGKMEQYTYIQRHAHKPKKQTMVD